VIGGEQLAKITQVDNEHILKEFIDLAKE